MTVRVTTDARANFVATGAWNDVPTYSVLWAGTHGLDADDFSAPNQLSASGDSYYIPAASQFNITATPGSGSAGDADEAIKAWLEAGADEITFQISLHDGAPGSDFTANELTAADNPGYARQTVTVSIAVV